jgi:hypothetical protein
VPSGVLSQTRMHSGVSDSAETSVSE